MQFDGEEPAGGALKRMKPLTEDARAACAPKPEFTGAAPDTDYQTAFDALVMCATGGFRGTSPTSSADSPPLPTVASVRVLPKKPVAKRTKNAATPAADAGSGDESAQSLHVSEERVGNAGAARPASQPGRGISSPQHPHVAPAHAVASGVPSATDDVCALCFKPRREGEDFRDVRNIHVHWARLMELLPPSHYLSEWTSRRHYYQFDPAIKLEKHFKCFTHEQVMFAFEDIESGKRCHKHCLHAFNFTVKTRFDQFARETGFTGTAPDVRHSCCSPALRHVACAYPAFPSACAAVREVQQD